MAIYHFSAQVISRSKGQSAVASASYRSGERLEDERTGETKYYVRNVQPETMILSPSHAPEWVQDRNRLWNEVEKSETRKNSQLAREINVALPRELSNEQQTELIKNYVQTEFVNKGMVADIAIHRDDKENPHAHVMMTTREISEEGFTVKNRDWNDRELLNQWREQWADHANKALEKEGIQERISHLSHEARGLEQMPTVHLGHVASAMEKEGKMSDRGNINRDRQEYNRLVVDLQKYREEKQVLQKEIAQEKKQQNFLTAAEKVDIKKAVPVVKGFVSLEKIEERREQIDQWEQRISKSESYLNWKSEAFEKAHGHINRQDNIQSQIDRNQNEIKNINWLNPLKIKENRLTKERCEKGIERLQKDYDYHDQKLDYYRDKLKFSTNDQFFEKAREFKSEREEKVSSIYKQKQEIREQKGTLDNAEKAIKQGQIREVASQYPELKTAGQYMRYETAMKLKEVNDKAGKTIPIDSIKSTIKARGEKIDELQGKIKVIDQANQRVNTAEAYYKGLHEVEKKIEKTENNPFLKGKMLFSKEAKNEHSKDLEKRDQYKAAIEKLGFKDKESFNNYKEKLQEALPEKPKMEQAIQNYDSGNHKGGHGFGTDFLQGIVQGVEQAQQRENREQKRQEKERYRGQKTHELER
ncbi:MobQ family relaxase [Micrococcus luteus]|uniref:MobQ family relaxase n=3 Tax=Bacillati TaxID=1783272 RepID=UPI0030167E85